MFLQSCLCCHYWSIKELSPSCSRCASPKSSVFVTVLGVAVGGTVFISTIIKLELFTIREWLSLPYGAKILRMRQKIKRGECDAVR